VIDPAIAAIKQAEQLIELRDRFGWAHAKIGGYESPPAAEIAAWRLREDFGADDVRNAWIFARPEVGAPSSG
jgi:allantoin racemase